MIYLTILSCGFTEKKDAGFFPFTFYGFGLQCRRHFNNCQLAQQKQLVPISDSCQVLENLFERMAAPMKILVSFRYFYKETFLENFKIDQNFTSKSSTSLKFQPL